MAQWCRDRPDAENDFDELKNRWGWGDFTTQDIAARSALAPLRRFTK
jgi:hypothetical protein